MRGVPTCPTCDADLICPICDGLEDPDPHDPDAWSDAVLAATLREVRQHRGDEP